MQSPARASGYDLFKLIVALILLILFLLLNRGATSQSPAPVSTPRVQTTELPASSPSILLTATHFPVASPASTSVSVSTVTPSPSSTQTTAITTPTLLRSPTLTNTPEPSTAPLPTATPVVESTAPPASESTASSTCQIAGIHSHLRTGMKATILRRLNFRSSPGIGDNWLRTNLPGTKVEIVGGPECIPHLTGAYIWWQIKLSDGQVGWSAEASRFGSFYFMEPAK